MKRGKLDKDQLVTLFGMMSIAQAGVIPSAEARHRAGHPNSKKRVRVMALISLARLHVLQAHTARARMSK